MSTLSLSDRYLISYIGTVYQVEYNNTIFLYSTQNFQGCTSTPCTHAYYVTVLAGYLANTYTGVSLCDPDAYYIIT